MPDITHELRLEPRNGQEEGGPSMYAVLVTDGVSQQPRSGCMVHIELQGGGSLESGQPATSKDETTREDGKAYFTWWPGDGQGPTTADLLIRVDEPEALLEVISLTPQREDELTEFTTDNVDPKRDAIERRAYEFYEQRGMEPGHEAEDWQRAETELGSRERY